MKNVLFALLPALLLGACGDSDQSAFSGADGEVKLIVLDPTDDAMAQVQSRMNPQIDPTVHVFAPEGAPLEAYLARIGQYNARPDSATSWNEVVSSEDDFLARMLADPQGNTALLSGGSSLRGGYLSACIGAGLNVLSSAPLARDEAGLKKLEEAFQTADQQQLVLCELTPERYEIAARLQRALARIPDFYGIQLCGTADGPAVVSESVLPLLPNNVATLTEQFTTPTAPATPAPSTTLLTAAAPRAGLIQLALIGQERVKYARQIQFTSGRLYPTALTPAQYKNLTGTDTIPTALRPLLAGDTLQLPCNGDLRYVFNGVHTRLSVRYTLPESSPGQQKEASQRLAMTGSDAILELVQTGDSLPQLFARAASGIAPDKFARSLREALKQTAEICPGVTLEPAGEGFRIVIPAAARTDAPARMRESLDTYLDYLVQGYPPFWEVDHTLAKYYTLIRGFGAAK